MSGQPNTLNTIQYNTQKSLNRVQVPFLCDENVQKADIIAIQEQGYARHAVETHNPSSCKFHLIANTDLISKICLYINKRIDTNTWNAVLIKPDICSVEIETKTTAGETRKIVVHSVYNPSPVSMTATEGPSSLPELTQALDRDGEHIVMGDFNLHHPYWTGPRSFSAHAMADKLINITTAARLDLLLPPGTITRQTHGQNTTINLIFSHEWFTDRLVNCRIREDLH